MKIQNIIRISSSLFLKKSKKTLFCIYLFFTNYLSTGRSVALLRGGGGRGGGGGGGGGGGAEGAARPGSHHFGVPPFYDKNRTKKKTTMCLTSVEMLSTGMY